MAEVKRTLQGLEEGVTYVVQVRSVNSLNVQSDWTDVLLITNGQVLDDDSTSDPPDTPTGFIATPTSRGLLVSWDAPSHPIKHWKLHATNDAAAAPSSSNLLGTVTGNFQSVSEYWDDLDTNTKKRMEVGQTYKLYLIAVGNTDVESSPASLLATPTATGNEDIAVGTISADRILANSFQAFFISGNTIRTSSGPSGQYVVMDNSGIKAYDGVANSFFLNSSTGAAYFKGLIEGSTISISPGDNRGFRVDNIGRMWMGSTSYNSAPFRVNNDGTLRLGSGADLEVTDGGIVSVKENGSILVEGTIRVVASPSVTGKVLMEDVGGYVQVGKADTHHMQIISYQNASNEKFARIDFNSSINPRVASIWQNKGSFTNNQNHLMLGGQDGLLERIRLATNYQDGTKVEFSIFKDGFSSNHFEWQHGSSVLMSLKKSGTAAWLGFPAGLPTGGSSANVQWDGTKLITVSSTRAVKRNIKDLIDDEISPLAVINALHPVTFDRIDSGPNRRSIGFIAEDVAQVSEQLVVVDKEGNPVGISFEEMTAMLAGAVKSLCERIQDLEDKQ